MKKLLTFLCSLTAIFALAQSDLNFGGNKVVEDLWFRTVFNENIADIQGSPYHEKNFQPAKLAGTNEALFARYNVYHDNLEFSKNDKIMVVPKEETYKSFHFLMTDEKIDLIDDGYYFNIYEGKNFQVYKKTKVKFQKFQKARAGKQFDKEAD